MKKINLNEFIAYLLDQIGQPYVLGGQHLKLTPENYVTAITRREKEEKNRAAAIAYCKARFDDGATILYGYDCSGLGMYWLQNVKNVYDHDKTANGMMRDCEIVDAPKRGYWVFRLGADGRATHIGYMVTDAEVVHAKGRAVGVVREAYKKSYWHAVGKPPMFDFTEKTHMYVKTKGRVRVREGNGTAFAQIPPTPDSGTLLPYFGQAETEPYWYEVEWQGRRGYISANKRYTEVIWKATNL